MEIALESNFHLCIPLRFLQLLVGLLYVYQNSTGLTGTSRLLVRKAGLHQLGNEAGEADGTGRVGKYINVTAEKIKYCTLI